MLLERRKFATKKPFKEIAQLFYEKAKEDGIDLRIHFSEELPRFFVGDIVRIKQVAANFLSNALKFTPKGGEINMLIAFDNAVQSSIGIDMSDLDAFMRDTIAPIIDGRFTKVVLIGLSKDYHCEI